MVPGKSGRRVPGLSRKQHKSVPGAIQMFRRECYQEIGGMLPIEYGGEDWYAEIMAAHAIRHRQTHAPQRSSLGLGPWTLGLGLSTCGLRVRASSVALCRGALWLVHSLQTESVTYIVPRIESLDRTLLPVTLLLRDARNRAGRREVGADDVRSEVFCALGMATKERDGGGAADRAALRPDVPVGDVPGGRSGGGGDSMWGSVRLG